MTKWNCVETRIDNGTKYGRIVRKIIFGDIFANRSQLLSQNPLNNNHKKLLKVSNRLSNLTLTDNIKVGCSRYDTMGIPRKLWANLGQKFIFC